jgi:hypothetical protein
MITQPKVSKIEYSIFSFEDFLQDCFLIESVKRPDEESRVSVATCVLNGLSYTAPKYIRMGNTESTSRTNQTELKK